MKIEKKINSLKGYLRNKKFLIAFSGGADSTFLASIAKEVADELLLVTYDNGVFPAHFTTKANKIAKELGLEHKIFKSDFLRDPIFCSNSSSRCYYCRKKMYKVLLEIAANDGFEVIMDGTNITDLMEDRPGLLAGHEYNIISPLVKTGFTASEVKKVLKDNNLNYSISTTCLATRIPRGHEITRDKIQMISSAENIIANHLNLEYLRVRYDDGFAILELDSKDELNYKINGIETELKEIGFKGISQINEIDKKKIEEITFYQPCKHYKGKLMFEKELPYPINIQETFKQMRNRGNVKKSLEMGIIMFKKDGINILIFDKGKIVARGIKDREEAQEILFELLPLIRRKLD